MGGGAAGAEAEGRLMSPIASAEIEVEGEEREMVTIDTPTAPEVNIVALLEQAPAVPEVSVYLSVLLCIYFLFYTFRKSGKERKIIVLEVMRENLQS